jgi:predicted phosphate transport protein (TIGR00153 family)
MAMRLLPRDERFFELFTSIATTTVNASKSLTELFRRTDEERWQLVETIKQFEHEADDVTHEIVTRLDRTFITPFDPEDIHELASKLDDIMDRIDSAARLARIFRVSNVPEGALIMCDVIQRAAEQMLTAVVALNHEDTSAVLAACRAIKGLEEEGDAAYYQWLGKLFEERPDPIMVLSWKELYDTLEKTLDSADDAANVLESVTIKHS